VARDYMRVRVCAHLRPKLLVRALALRNFSASCASVSEIIAHTPREVKAIKKLNQLHVY